MTEQRDEFDSPWKNILETYFPDFMQFFFPQIHEDIDWNQGYDFLDQELQQVVRDAELGKRLADKLVKVWKLSGEETWVLVHIEIQSQEESQFNESLERCHFWEMVSFSQVSVSTKQILMDFGFKTTRVLQKHRIQLD